MNMQINPRFIVVSCVFIALCTVIPSSVEAAQQCVKCSSSGCNKSILETKPCNRSCFTITMRQDSPYDKDTFLVKGCTSDLVFYSRSCANKCYDKKKKFGSSMYYMCVYCCTGDRCNQPKDSYNSGSQAKAGIILVAVSTTITVLRHLYFQGGTE